MKIIIVPSNTDLNRGDQALVWESINLVKEVYDNPEIILMKDGNEQQFVQTQALGYKLIDNVLRHPGRVLGNNNHVHYSFFDFIRVGVCALVDLFLSSLLLVNSKIVNGFVLLLMPKCCRTSYEEFSKCDAVFVKGGGFIHSYGSIIDPYQMYYLLYNLLLGLRFKKKVYVLPNSIGPIKSRLAGKLVDYVLNKCKYVSVRESVSQSFLNSRDTIKVPVYKHYDLGYYLEKSTFNAKQYLVEKGLDISKPKVGITLRPYRFPGAENPEQLYRNYIDVFVNFCAYLDGQGFQVVLCSHTLGPSAHENDTLAIQEVGKRLVLNKIHFFEICDMSLTCKDTMALYSYFDYFIGTRFHSVIFSQNSFVPTIAISYGGNKGVGIMEDLGLSEYTIPIEKVSISALESSFKKLVFSKENIIEKLKQHRHRLQDDRKIMLSEIKRSLS